MAPKMKQGCRVGKFIDVWSFGVILFEVFIGTLADNQSLAIAALRERDVPSPCFDFPRML